VNNDQVRDQMIQGDVLATGKAPNRHWEHINLNLTAYKKQRVVIRLYALVLVPNHYAGNSYWKHLDLQ
jgi:hypothetical protein